jgi:hypothetical protein
MGLLCLAIRPDHSRPNTVDIGADATYTHHGAGMDLAVHPDDS